MLPIELFLHLLRNNFLQVFNNGFVLSQRFAQALHQIGQLFLLMVKFFLEMLGCPRALRLHQQTRLRLNFHLGAVYVLVGAALGTRRLHIVLLLGLLFVGFQLCHAVELILERCQLPPAL